jgi:hypothetical protein
MTAEDASAKPLSTAQGAALTVTVGKPNSLNVTLSGIPKRITATVFDTNTFLINALDAGDYLITGAGAPAFVISAGSSVIVTQPTAASPNLFHARQTRPGNATITATASYPSGATGGCASGVCTQNFMLTSSPLTQTVWVVNGNATVHAYDVTTGSQVALLSGFTSPSSIAVDLNGNVFVGDPATNTVSESVPPYTSSAVAISGLEIPFGLAVDSKDNVWVSNSDGQKITEYAPPYSGSPIATIESPQYSFSYPQGLAFDASDNLFAADLNNGKIVEFAPPYTAAPLNIGSGISSATGVAVDGSGNVVVSDGSESVYQWSPPYTSEPASLSIGGLSGADGLGFDGSNNLYIANVSSIVVRAPGATTVSPFVTGLFEPSGLAVYVTYSSSIAASP